MSRKFFGVGLLLKAQFGYVCIISCGMNLMLMYTIVLRCNNLFGKYCHVLAVVQKNALPTCLRIIILILSIQMENHQENLGELHLYNNNVIEFKFSCILFLTDMLLAQGFIRKVAVTAVICNETNDDSTPQT